MKKKTNPERFSKALINTLAILSLNLFINKVYGQSLDSLGKALIEVVQSGNYQHVNEIIIKGANVNYVGKHKYGMKMTPLIFALRREAQDSVEIKNSIAIIKLLILNGANVNWKTQYGTTPLFDAEIPEIAKILLENGAEINVKDSISNRTPLMSTENADVAKLLIENGAELEATDRRGMTALHIAAGNRLVRIVEILIASGAKIDSRNADKETPLLYTCWYNKDPDTTIVKLLLDHGADMNAKNKRGESALMLIQEINGFKLIINEGADINAKDNNGRTVLHLKLSNSSKELIFYLLNRGARVNEISLEGRTALHYILQTNEKITETDRIEIINALFSHDLKVDINKKDKWGETVLEKALESSQKELTKFLVSKGAFISFQKSLLIDNVEFAMNFTNTLTGPEGNLLLQAEGITFDKESIIFSLPILTISSNEVVLHGKDRDFTFKITPITIFCNDNKRTNWSSFHIGDMITLCSDTDKNIAKSVRYGAVIFEASQFGTTLKTFKCQ